MTCWITAMFTESGAPKLGLVPLIRIYDLADNSLIITDAPMVEVDDGVYKYEFTEFNDSVDYAIRCDGVYPSLDSRYMWGDVVDAACIRSRTNKLPDDTKKTLKESYDETCSIHKCVTDGSKTNETCQREVSDRLRRIESR